MSGRIVIAMGLLAVLVLVAGCGHHPPPEKAGGRLIPGTEDLAGLSWFSISPRGTWLLFPLMTAPEGEATIALIRLEDEKRFDVTVTEEAKPLIKPYYVEKDVRWDHDERAVLFVPYRLPRKAVELRLDSPPFQMQPSPDPKRWDPDLDNWELVPRTDYEWNQGSWSYEFTTVDVESSQKQVVISHDERVLAKHREPWLSPTTITLEIVAYSPDRSHLAYAISRFHMLAAGNPGFVVPTDGSRKPRYLGSALFKPILWDPVRPRVYAIVLRRDVGIYYWRVDQ
ncbi:MAG: hypothetical protein AAGD38_07210 [Acidobacteriota bacterium]